MGDGLGERDAAGSEVTVKVEATLLDPRDGKERVVTQEVEEEYADAETQHFMWTEGNYGCDCNKKLFIERAAGKELSDEVRCGNEIQLLSLVVGGIKVV